MFCWFIIYKIDRNHRQIQRSIFAQNITWKVGVYLFLK